MTDPLEARVARLEEELAALRPLLETLTAHQVQPSRYRQIVKDNVLPLVLGSAAGLIALMVVVYMFTQGR
jgi:hypothetical protein